MIKKAVCVYKTGGDYNLEYVERLVASIREYAPDGVEVYCLSNDPNVASICHYVPLTTEWTGWWCKLELFKHFDEAVYFDLDTVIRGDISNLFLYPHTFSMLSDFYHPSYPASGVMAWKGDYTYISEGFEMSRADEYKQTGKWGDQGWITDHLGFAPTRIQNIAPGTVASFKRPYNSEPVICFHGNPRPHVVGWKV